MRTAAFPGILITRGYVKGSENAALKEHAPWFSSAFPKYNELGPLSENTFRFKRTLVCEAHAGGH